MMSSTHILLRKQFLLQVLLILHLSSFLDFENILEFFSRGLSGQSATSSILIMELVVVSRDEIVAANCRQSAIVGCWLVSKRRRKPLLPLLLVVQKVCAWLFLQSILVQLILGAHHLDGVLFLMAREHFHLGWFSWIQIKIFQSRNIEFSLL